MARAVQKALPNAEIVFRNDKEHVPYGMRDLDEIYSFAEPILRSMVDDRCRVIVIACNTVTTNLIEQLRRQLPIPLVGMEPMIKPAAEASRSGVIAVCATPRTLQSERYAWLKNTYAFNTTVLEPDCSDWSNMIETNQVDRDKIANIIDDVSSKGADQIVLGCTHYHWIEELIREIARSRAEVMQPEIPVIEQLKRVIERIA